jgi:hypothetical protein
MQIFKVANLIILVFMIQLSGLARAAECQLDWNLVKLEKRAQWNESSAYANLLKWVDSEDFVKDVSNNKAGGQFLVKGVPVGANMSSADLTEVRRHFRQLIESKAGFSVLEAYSELRPDGKMLEAMLAAYKECIGQKRSASALGFSVYLDEQHGLVTVRVRCDGLQPGDQIPRIEQDVIATSHGLIRAKKSDNSKPELSAGTALSIGKDFAERFVVVESHASLILRTSRGTFEAALQAPPADGLKEKLDAIIWQKGLPVYDKNGSVDFDRIRSSYFEAYSDPYSTTLWKAHEDAGRLIGLVQVVVDSLSSHQMQDHVLYRVRFLKDHGGLQKVTAAVASGDAATLRALYIQVSNTSPGPSTSIVNGYLNVVTDAKLIELFRAAANAAQ